MNETTLLLSRLHFALTIGFHILFPVLTIGLSIFLVIFEAAWLVTRKEYWYHHLRFWSRLFLLNFGIGVVTGIVMEFQFGTNWARFAQFAGGFFGNVLGFEAAIAFAAESAFLALMMFGWKRVSRGAHFFATCMVAFAAVLSAFWIMDANSWMQKPVGVLLQQGRMEVIDYGRAIFNPFLWVSFVHKFLACMQIGVLVVGGISAWYLSYGRDTGFFLRSFKTAAVLGIMVAPAQIIAGDFSGRAVYKMQPEKGAAMDSHWETNPAGKGAAWSVIAWPDSRHERNSFAVEIPDMLSILATHSPRGTVRGMREFHPLDRPPIVLPFYAFRVMIALGTFFAVLALASLWQWARGQLHESTIGRHRLLLRIWFWSIPLGYLAMEAGWIVREVGRQPWTLYRLQRVGQGVTIVDYPVVLTSLIAYAALYALLFSIALFFAQRIVRGGPEFSPSDSSLKTQTTTEPSGR